MPCFGRIGIVVLLSFPRRPSGPSLSTRPRVRQCVGVYGWFLLLILRPASSAISCQTPTHRYRWVEATNLEFFHFIATHSFLRSSLCMHLFSRSSSLRHYHRFASSFFFPHSSSFFFALYSPSFLTLSLSPYPCLSCVRTPCIPAAWFRFICKLREGAARSRWKDLAISACVRICGRGHLKQRNWVFTQHIMQLAVHVWRNGRCIQISVFGLSWS